jgi:selenocysteine lyase/cysteine desulfurase
VLQAAFNTPRGEVLVSEAEFPANTYPWARAEVARRFKLRRFHPEPGYVTAGAVAAELTPEITLVSVSAVDFRTGYRADLAAIREVVGDRLLVVDGIQGSVSSKHRGRSRTCSSSVGRSGCGPAAGPGSRRCPIGRWSG